jgi:predicted nucleic acid-binding protein
MPAIFADTFYWIALLNVKDTWHSQVIEVSQEIVNSRLVITDGVVDEIFSYYSKRGDLLRLKVSLLYQSTLTDSNVQIIGYTPELRQKGIELYEQRLDKGYSLVDCISMIVMKEMKISEVLTNDKHFAQEGFNIRFSEL